MEKEEHWGPWITWVQGPAPLGGGYVVVAEMGEIGSNDFVGPLKSEDFDWDYPGDPVVRYRVKKPKALRQLINWAENLPVLAY